MDKKNRRIGRRRKSLTRDCIIDAAIELLDARGEEGLTFRALSERLVTGAGAIYWHISSKSELLTAACDALIARTMDACLAETTPPATIRAVALGMFDAMEAHPWIGSALAQAPGELPMIRILEGIGRQTRALELPDEEQWAVVGALLNFILGVGGRNAANQQLARTQGINRSDLLNAVATRWSTLDEQKYPFTRSIASQVRAHDDRVDYIAGIDLILRGIES